MDIRAVGVFASFANSNTAELVAQEVAMALDIPTKVSTTTRQNQLLYRVTTEVSDRWTIKTLLRNARTNGYEGAWLLPMDTDSAITESSIFTVHPSRSVDQIDQSEDRVTAPVPPSLDKLESSEPDGVQQPLDLEAYQASIKRRSTVEPSQHARTTGSSSGSSTISSDQKRILNTTPTNNSNPSRGSLFQLDIIEDKETHDSDAQSDSGEGAGDTSERFTASENLLASTPGPNSRTPLLGSTQPTALESTLPIAIKRIDNPDITIDGSVDEAVWAKVPGFDNMKVVNPETLVDAPHRTLTRLIYGSSGLYVSAIMEQPPTTLVTRLAGRDQDVNADSYGITIDTSGEALFGFWFILNLGGTKLDGKIVPERSQSYQWDGAWQGETKTTATGWSAELFIPWSIVAMPSRVDIRRLNFFVTRKVAYANESYGWPALSRSSPKFMSAFQPMTVQGINPRQQWEIFPYVSSTNEGMTGETESRTGVNFSWRPAPNIQVTGAVNPDFGAVESDDVVVNLSSYETYFPEKRQFFLEGSEIFLTSPRSIQRQSSSRGSGARSAPSTWRSAPTTLLNTRRIGGSATHFDDDLVPDVDIEPVELSQPTNLQGAVKVVGQSSSIRFGLLGAFEDEVEMYGTRIDNNESTFINADGREFGVARLIYEHKQNAGRKALGYLGTIAAVPDFLSNEGYDAVVHGIDSHYVSPKGEISVDLQLMQSQKRGINGNGALADIQWVPGKGHVHGFRFDYLDEDLDISDLGFVRMRPNDRYGFSTFYSHTASANLPQWLRTRRIGLFTGLQKNLDGQIVQGYVGANVRFLFANQSQISIDTNFLPASVEDSWSDVDPFETRKGWFQTISYGTDAAKKLSWSVQVGYRDRGVETAPTYLTDVGFTLRPTTRFSVDYDVRLAKSDGGFYRTDPGFGTFKSDEVQQIFSLDFFLTANQQLRMTMQWSGLNALLDESWQTTPELGELIPRINPTPREDDFAISRMTAQIRYRWEIAPLSDLFVVYTRGSNIYERLGDTLASETTLLNESFSTSFREAIDRPIVDTLVIKFRYRFGS